MNNDPWKAIDDFVLKVSGPGNYVGNLLVKILLVLGIIAVAYAIFQT